MNRITGIALTLVLVAPAAATSQSSTINTDRPDFTESSTLVPRHRIQFEAGVSRTVPNTGSGAGSSITYPELLVRYGLTGHVELRAAQSFFSQAAIAGGSRTSAREDLYLGAKLGLGEQQGARPKLALLLQATVPTGDDAGSQNATLPGAAILAGWALSPDWSLDVGLDANRVTGDAYEVAPSLSAGRALTQRLRGYAELYANLPWLNESGARKQWYANAGLALLLSENVQVDIRYGAGLTDASDRSFFGAGFSIRP